MISPGRSISPRGIKTSRCQSQKIQGKKHKFPRQVTGNDGKRGHYYFHPLLPGPMFLIYCNTTRHRMVVALGCTLQPGGCSLFSQGITSKVMSRHLFHCSNRSSAAVKWVPCSEAMLCSISCRWNKHHVSPQKWYGAKSCGQKKTNPYTEIGHFFWECRGKFYPLCEGSRSCDRRKGNGDDRKAESQSNTF